MKGKKEKEGDRRAKARGMEIRGEFASLALGGIDARVDNHNCKMKTAPIDRKLICFDDRTLLYIRKYDIE